MKLLASTSIMDDINNTHELILTLQGIKGFGPKRIAAFLEAYSRSLFQSQAIQAEDILQVMTSMQAGGTLKGLSRLPDLEELAESQKNAQRIVEESEEQGIGMVSFLDEDYPGRLLSTVDENGRPDIPILVYYKGDLSITSNPNMASVAIIGTRRPSPEGVTAGTVLGGFFHGFNVVSGLAVGCDTAAHRGALAHNGITTAVLAHGLDSVYPKENESLAQEIVDKGGLLLSEYPVGVPVSRNNLVRRDRLQAALADAVIVVQTGINGGTMHAVNAALAAVKLVYAVDYKKKPFGEEDVGNRFLINSGKARPLRSDNKQDAFRDIIAKG